MTRGAPARLHLALIGLAMSVACAEDRPPRAIPRPALSPETEAAVVRAVEDARRAVERSPRSAEAWARLGHVAFVHGWEEDAILAYRGAVDLEPEDHRWRYFLARSLADRDPEAALAELETAFATGSVYPPAHAEHARLLRELGRDREAALRLARLEELAPENPVAPLLLGEIELAAGRPAEARDHLQRAVERNPGHSEAHRALSRAYLALGDRDAAERHAEMGRRPSRYRPLPDPLWDRVEATGATRRWFAERGRRRLTEGRFSEAADELARAVSEDEVTPLLRLNLGLALLGARRYAEAVPVLERARAEAGSGGLDPLATARIHAALSGAYSGTGDLAAAEDAARSALEIDPGSVDALANLALVLHLRGRTDAAIRLLRESGVEDPALERLRQELLGPRPPAPEGG